MERQDGRNLDPAAATWLRVAERMTFLAVFLVLDGLFLIATVFFAGAGGVALIAAVAAGLVAGGARVGAYLVTRLSGRQHTLGAAPVRHHGRLVTH